MTIKEKSQRMMEETLEMLRSKPAESTLTERWFLLEEARASVQGLSQPLQMGKGLEYILERASLPVEEYDLLLGRFIDKVPTPEEEARFWEIWKDDKPLSNPITMYNGGHITLDWKHILSRGIPGYIEMAERRLEEERSAGAEQSTLDFLEGMALTYRAIQRYIVRYGEAAAQAGLDEMGQICQVISSGPPETFHQALQLMLFVLNVYYIYAGNINTTLTYGRMDDLLLPYYEADCKAGRLTREDAGCLMDVFNCMASLPLGRGEHQMADPSQGGCITGWQRNHVFDDPTYVVIGGYSNTTDYTVNPLTKLMLERIHPRLENPVYIYRWTKNDPADVWELLCDKLRQNASILVYNDETMIPAMQNAGIAPEDAVDYTLHACNWPDVPSYSVVDTIGGPIPKMIMAALLEGDALRRNYASLDELYEAVAQDFRKLVQEHFAAYRARYRSGKPLPAGVLNFTDCFTDGTLERARGGNDGGVRYPAIYTLVRNIGTAADMMAALEQVVYQEKSCTLEEMARALADDFAAEPGLLANCLQAPKFGTDNDTADRHAVRLLTMLLDIIDQESCNEQGERDVISFNVTITDMFHIQEGATLCATPDGRRCGAPLSENLSPTVGQVESVTALLNSVSKLPFGRIHAGAFNLRLRGDLVKGDEGLHRLMTLAETYLEDGGMQCQVSVADTAELRRAQEHPEDYKDLMVRITGYSAVFVDMSRNAQEEIIRRDEMGA